MLSGDNRGTAEAIRREADINEIQADLLPADQVAAISELVPRYKTVAMVGDGINDAPALSLGIAIGAAGNDHASRGHRADVGRSLQAPLAHGTFALNTGHHSYQHCFVARRQSGVCRADHTGSRFFTLGCDCGGHGHVAPRDLQRSPSSSGSRA